MNLPKIHSISKKILVALIGTFLLLFLLFHMTANLFILRHDDGEWYSAFCNFMGTNWVVKIFEICLLAFFMLHMCLTLWLAITNWMARPVRYHQSQRSKTHTTSKLMVWTGILIFAALALHFTDFYFVKLGLVKGDYMVKTEEFSKNAMANQSTISEDDYAQLAEFMETVQMNNMLSEDTKWIKHISHEDKEMLNETLGLKVEPDFYTMTRNRFHNPWIVLCYLAFFVVIFFHLRHAFPSAFQTLGLNNYKYNNIIEILGDVYTWCICLGFAIVVILVYLGL